MSDENKSKTAPALGSDSHGSIGQELRLIDSDIMAEGVPERLAQILRKLDEPSNEGGHDDARTPQAARSRPH